MLVTGHNLEIGIPNKIFCLSDSLIIEVFYQVNILPMLILACQLCPKNIEGTVYAIIMSAINFGGLLG